MGWPWTRCRLTVVWSPSYEDAPGSRFDQFKLFRTRQADFIRDRLYKLVGSTVEVEACKRLREQAHVLPIDERNLLTVPEEVF